MKFKIFLLCAFLCVFVPSWLKPASKLNVLLISVDTLRADHLGCYGYSTRTPAFDRIAQKAIVFENAISQVPLTLPSHCTILTGLYPDQNGVRNNENFVLPAKIQTLAENFRANGYSTGAVVGSFSLDSTFGINQGFQFYEDRIGQGHDPEVNRNVQRRAETVWKIGRKWLDEQKAPWFCFLHFFDPHTAYDPPSPYPKTYDGEIAYVDHVLSEIEDYLDQKHLLSTTVLVLLSDHGESLGEHGETSHGVFLYDATLRVPLIIATPGYAPQRIKSQVRLVDVAPTIAELARLQRVPAFSGESLVAAMKGKGRDLPAYSETYYTNLLMGWAPLHSMRFENKKWIDAPKPELYNLASDPHELKNVYKPSMVPDGFRSELRKHSVTKQPVSAARPVDPEVQEKLASLGYVTGGSANPVSSSFDPKDGIQVWTEIEDAVVSAETGNLEKSKQMFRDVLQKQPDNVIAQKFFAAVLRKSGEDEQAIHYLKAALKSNLHQNDTRVALASIYFDKREYQQALELLTPVMKEEPQNWRALKMAAMSYSFLQRDREALDAFNKLSAARPLSEEESLQVAGIYLTDRNILAAEKYFQLAIQSNAKSQAAWKGIALIQASREKWGAAADAFLKAGDCANAKQILQKIQKPPDSLLQAIHQKCE